MENKEWKEMLVGLMEIQGLSARMQEIEGLVLEMKEMKDTSARMTEIKEKIAMTIEMNKLSARFLVMKEVSARILELMGVMMESICSRLDKNLTNSSSISEEEYDKVFSLSHVSESPILKEIVPDLVVFAPDLDVLGSEMGVPNLDVCGSYLGVPGSDLGVLDMDDLAMKKVQVWRIVHLVIIVRGRGSKSPSMFVLGELHPLVLPSFSIFDGGGPFCKRV